LTVDGAKGCLAEVLLARSSPRQRRRLRARKTPSVEASLAAHSAEGQPVVQRPSPWVHRIAGPIGEEARPDGRHLFLTL